MWLEEVWHGTKYLLLHLPCLVAQGSACGLPALYTRLPTAPITSLFLTPLPMARSKLTLKSGHLLLPIFSESPVKRIYFYNGKLCPWQWSDPIAPLLKTLESLPTANRIKHKCPAWLGSQGPLLSGYRTILFSGWASSTDDQALCSLPIMLSHLLGMSLFPLSDF